MNKIRLKEYVILQIMWCFFIYMTFCYKNLFCFESADIYKAELQNYIDGDDDPVAYYVQKVEEDSCEFAKTESCRYLEAINKHLGYRAFVVNYGIPIASQFLNILDSPLKPDEIPDGFEEVTIDTRGRKVRAWKKGAYYIVYAQISEDETGYFVVDTSDEENMSWIRYDTQLFN